MSHERWQRVKELFGAALEQAPGERAAFLDQVCGPEDLEVRREVEALLAAHEQSDSFLETPAAALVSDASAEPGPFAEGQTIGRYRLLGLLGAGGMGQVYLAEDPRLRRRIALKLLPRSLSRDEERLRRFEQEARVASALSHPNVCVIHEVGETGEGEEERRFIAMEHVPGESLRQRLERHRAAGTRMPLAEVLEIVQQAAAGLAAAHAAGIVHRDVKPENVMVRPDGLVKLLDFGLAKLAERSAPGSDAAGAGVSGAYTEPGMVLGTVQYMSPEQTRGLPVDARTDIWSLGATLYEMLAGRAAFEGPTTSDVMVAVLDREPPLLADLVPASPAELQRIVDRALRKNREERYRTARALLSDLETLRRELDWEARQGRRGASGAQAEGPSPAPTAGMRSRGSGRGYRRTAALLGVAVLTGLLVASALYLGPLGAGRTEAGELLVSGADPAWERSIAVLPFVDRSAEEGNEYFSDGLTEELLNGLARIEGLQVVARTSSFSFKGQNVPVDSIGRALRVAHVLEGSVRKAGERVRITVQLINVSTGYQLWSQTYDRHLQDVFAVQGEISRAIVEQLQVRLRGDAAPLVKQETADPEAHTLVLKSIHAHQQHTRQGLSQAIAFLEQAIERDPRYARAHAELGWAHHTQATYRYVAPEEGYARARAAANRALTLDPELSDAHTILGLIADKHDWDFTRAEEHYRRALTSNPGDAWAHSYRAFPLLRLGRREEAIQAARRAVELDPLNPVAYSNRGLLHNFLGQNEQAVQQYQAALALDPDSPHVLGNLALAYADGGRAAEAIRTAERAREADPEEAYYLMVLGYAHIRAGNRSQAERILRELQTQPGVSPYMLATLHAGLSNREQAFALLERAVAERDAFVPDVGVDPAFREFRSDPRMRQLLRRLGLP